MRRVLSALVLACPAVLAAADAVPGKKSDFAAISLLPDGSQLHEVMLPRYNERHELLAVLKAGHITLDNPRKMTGGRVSVEFFNPDRTSRGRIDLATATFLRDRNLLTTGEPVEVRSQRLTAQGAGLYYSLETNEGFLVGPVTTTILPAPVKTTMKTPAPTLRPALLGMAVLAQAAVAQEPPAADAARQTRADLRATLAASAEANQAVTAFLDKADLLAAADSAATPPAEPQPLEVEPDPRRTVIESDGGFYFDAVKGVFAFLQNVRVDHPQFELTGANDLKVFLEKSTKPQPAKGLVEGGGLDLGDVERIVATGAVKITQKNPKKGESPLVASGAVFTYNMKTKQITISGGSPWFTLGDKYARAREPNLTLRIDENFNAATEGNWDAGLILPEKK